MKNYYLFLFIHLLVFIVHPFSARSYSFQYPSETPQNAQKGRSPSFQGVRPLSFIRNHLTLEGYGIEYRKPDGGVHQHWKRGDKVEVLFQCFYLFFSLLCFFGVFPAIKT